MNPSETLPEKSAAEAPPESNKAAGWRCRWHEIIFEADTPKGKAFDIGLLIAIVISVFIVMLQSVEHIEQQKPIGSILEITEWVITIGFSIEYALRIACVRQPFRYIFSFWGIVDLLSVLPTYVGVMISPSTQSFSVVRVLRLIRVFRIFKLNNYIQESRILLEALKAARPKIIVFLLVVMSLILVMGTTVYVIEDLFSSEKEENQFTSIPQSIYWAIVTITTVGYGDMAPTTAAGQTIAAIAMILGYAIIIVPSGIFSVEIIAASKAQTNTQACMSCTKEGHDDDAVYCKYCGAKL